MFSGEKKPPILLRCSSSLLLFLSAACLIFWFPSSPETLIQQQHDLHIQHHDPPHVNQTRNQNNNNNNNKNADGLITPTKPSVTVPTCNQKLSVYLYTLPKKFNLGLLHNCHNLNFRTDMCPHVANSGLGQPLPTMGPTLATNSSSSWFATNQFAAEIIFHARLLNHPCRTYDPTRATLFYVPYYGGLHVSSKFRERNLTARDELDVSLVDYLQSQSTWQKHNGKDHFITLGRIVRDFTSSWIGAGRLLKLAGVENMSVLIIERNPFKGSNQHGIPYPSYFHPSTWQEMSTWQTKMRETHRHHLFSFIGAKRRKAAIRNEFIKQCGESTRCMLLNCRGSNEEARKCQEPSEVLKVMSESVFCLQAPGDSFTRRSTFDSVLAGCIPVFFSPHTAYSQYQWYLPGERSKYSVYIDQRSKARKRIEEVLLKIPSEKVRMMREKIIGLIPSLTYANPNASDFGFEDAVDVALASLAEQVKKFVD
ncbi:putative exostosin [Rosa chinensis]|uniref:Putative exostosin n=1 Tax=Rosa chinensis TaxID=74649 RepID=A0A2P6RQV5_ROSCH|nr:probable xyloglucan galactosyltransferase GT17 [Rosa chinensis]PRQ48771.1 putative exostosin [Rosa chinensis]